MRSLRRLFEIVEIIRSRRNTTAAWLAQMLGVSERTIYRSVQDLQLAGIPIIGTPGEGYRLMAGFNLRPLTFTDDELEVLAFGLALVRQSADAQLGAAADTAESKIRAVLPHSRQLDLSAALSAPAPLTDATTRSRLALMRSAIRERLRLQLDYTDDAGNQTARSVLPLNLAFWGRTWTLIAWCELRADFRMFRLDRVRSLSTATAFAPVPGRTLEDFLARMRGVADS